ncbi:hypothetical protein [Actinoplanes sp. L3-i22]|uniref:hypothetical protein n=1 Tax=Actinoplanes sp. L3-i22 TaxID=2836373 RepID=UPI001C7432CC|nr:hypothetical protein [Actinoplanes sp. L3-i22]BCY11407.1 hypothetical protein L3i22_064950 [Actinoplanes sp. L3-i22]
MLGDPGFLDRAPQRVTLAAAYHSTRAATPMHPAHRIVDARWAALYRPVREAAWKGQNLRPLPPTWVSSPDAFGDAARLLKRAGREVSAWIVLTHNTRLGTLRPDVAVENSFGEIYPYALCPAHQEVRDHAATLAAEAVLDLDLDGVSLEACGQLGVSHLGHHEKTDGAFSAETARLLSICCCTACRRAWTDAGLDPSAVVAALRAGNPSDEVLSTVLEIRHRHTDLLRAQVLAGTAGLPVTLHAHPDPWATGPSPGLTPAAAAATSGVDTLLVPCWPPGSADLVRAAAQHGKPVDAYVTLLHPMAPDEVRPHVQALRAAGATRLSLYHLGLAPAWRQELFTALD